MQTELFPIQKQIPDWLAEHFNNANSGTYNNKNLFYTHVKPAVLNQFAQPAGYDLQIIEHKCWSCGGTGQFKHYHYEFGQRYLINTEPCFKCNKGIYYTARIVLKRYILNGVVYHIPAPELSLAVATNTIKGIIKHPPIDSDKAFKSFLIVFWKYAPEEFRYYIKSILTDKCNEKVTWLKDWVATIFRKQNTCDELPF